MRLTKSNATRKNLGSEDLRDEERLRGNDGESSFVAVATVKGSSSKAYAHGYGDQNRFNGNNGYAYFDLQLDDGSGTIVNANGRFRQVVYDSDDLEEPKYIGDEYDLGAFREAVNDARTERPLIPLSDVGAKEDEVIAWEVEVEPSQDSYTVSASDSEVQLPFSQWRV